MKKLLHIGWIKKKLTEGDGNCDIMDENMLGF